MKHTDWTSGEPIERTWEMTTEYDRHLERGCACPERPTCVEHGAREFGGGEPDVCASHDHLGPVVDWHAVASELAPPTLAEWEAVVARHTVAGVLVEEPS